MKASLVNKLQTLDDRFGELEALLADPDIMSDQSRYTELTKEYSDLTPIVKAYRDYQAAAEEEQEAKVLLSDSDPEMKALGKESFEAAQKAQETLADELQILLLPTDPNDGKNIFLEIRAGTGGDEAALFSGDLAKMYMKYAERQGWRVEIMSDHAGDHGGHKELIMRISGEAVYRQLKFESGAHRVQRVPATESQGRVHTSACTVAILAEASELDEIEINPADLKVDTYRASGAGGQHVNKTDSAVRLTHIPTGTVVECQDERSQHKNKARAMSILQSRIMQAEQQKMDAELASERRNLVGSGDRSERIRTYNYPQGRVTDHRINLTLYKLEEILSGDLHWVVDALIQEHQADLLAAQSQDS